MTDLSLQRLQLAAGAAAADPVAVVAVEPGASAVFFSAAEASVLLSIDPSFFASVA